MGPRSGASSCPSVTGRTGDGPYEVASLIGDAVGMPSSCLLTFRSPEDILVKDKEVA
ncbi:hypothetical protein [Rhizobium leguminosarum]|uniref:hypothetical protein n=1 Tax=Rhizobium leguminosarum TaxID=384 RepID=UPI0013AF86B8|nr:hypothetical protein [Rhizobium leguminosarum]